MIIEFAFFPLEYEYKWLIITFICSVIIQLFYYLFFYLRLAFYKEKQAENASLQAVSVVICARNEETNLRKNLPTILEQDYQNFEVIVVNDSSTDESGYVLAEYKQKYKNLYVTTIEKDHKFTHGKKLALTVGLKAAKHDIVLLTDADCYAPNNKWLANMQRHFTPKIDFVLGYGAYERKKNLLNYAIRYDTFFIALQYLSFSLAGLPYMGVGRNLAYRKSMFFKNKGFASHIALASGDDDLFVNANANKSNTKIELSHQSITYSEPQKNFNLWIRQKRRHYTTAQRYRLHHKILLSLEILSRQTFYFCFCLLIFFDTIFFYINFALFLVRFVVQLLVIFFSTRKMKEKDLFFVFLFFDIAIPLFSTGIYLLNFFRRSKNKWK